MTKWWVVSGLTLALIAGCAGVIAPPLRDHLTAAASGSERRLCADLFLDAERRVAAAGVIDSEAARIAGFPYLRVDRFLSDFRREVNGPRFEAWVDRMQALALRGWAVELANLPESPGIGSLADLRRCAGRLRRIDLSDDAGRDLLRRRAVVAPEYRQWQRVVGLYPLTALFFRLGISRWQATVLESYARPVTALPVSGRPVRYAPETGPAPIAAAEVARLLREASDNPLNIPQPEGAARVRLFAAFAPVFEIDTVSADDRIGAPWWDAEAEIRIDTGRPTVYQRLSHTRVGSRVLLQLNYTVWFPARPRTSALDLLGGRLDGITWRVTLLPDGRPWVFDTIHNCGCYHLFFPTRLVRRRPANRSILNEPALMPQASLDVTDAGRPLLRIAHRTHYVERVTLDRKGGGVVEVVYRSEDADGLRSLPTADGGRRSLFGEDGIVAGSERLERFVFWPMGVPQPGAMRQWGHHATAFVGQRHFDDARLFESLFAIE